MTTGPLDPLILTVTLDPISQAQFDRLRARYFPPSLNHLPAHVTLFHHLPGAHRNAIEARLAETCRALGPCPFTATGLRFLGRGTAYALDMPAVATLRRDLAAGWAAWLIPQDRQPWHPHVTVQNKAPPILAKRAHAELLAGFAPFSGVAAGLHLWAYLGGPWRSLAYHPFLKGVLGPSP